MTAVVDYLEKGANPFEIGFMSEVIRAVGLSTIEFSHPSYPTPQGRLRLQNDAKAVTPANPQISAGEGGTSLLWTDLNDKPLIRLSGLSLTDAELRAGLGIGTPDEGKVSVSYPFLVSLLDGNVRVKGNSDSNRDMEVGAGGKAKVTGGKGDDELFVWHEKTVDFDGGTGIDTILFRHNGVGSPYPTEATQQLVIDLGKGKGQNPYGGKLKLKNVENVVGTPQADKITGDNKANVIGDGVYDVGADIIKAKGGNDVVRIGNFSEGGVRADGGKGKDELQFSISQPTAEEATTILDIANPGNNTGPLKGSVFKGFDILTAQNFTGSYHHLDFRGSKMGETVVGSIGADKLDGRGGDDTLDGRGGPDTLIGGSGKDTFQFSFGLVAGNVDTIVDFVPGTDRIALSSFVFEAVGAPGKLAAGKFNALSSQDGNDVILYEKSTGRLYHDGDGLGGAAPTHFATLANNADLKAGDIIVV